MYGWIGLVLLLLLFIPGCTEKPVLTREDTYSIIVISPQGQAQNIPVQFSWNSNFAVLQKLLIEASFVLSDLHSKENPPVESSLSQSTVMLQAHFPKSRDVNLTVDDHPMTLHLDSIEIEVDGPHQGRIILNQTPNENLKQNLNPTIILQGIPDPNLKPTFDDFMDMLRNSTSKSP